MNIFAVLVLKAKVAHLNVFSTEELHKKSIYKMVKQQFAIAFLSALVFLIFANLAVAQNVIPGKCFTLPKRVENLDFDRFAHLWTQHKKIGTSLEGVSTCNTLEFISLGGGAFKAIFGYTADGAAGAIEGSGSVLPNGQLSIIVHTPSGDVKLDFWVVDTDYDNYATLYSCSSAGNYIKEYAYILTTPNATSVHKGAARQALTDNGVSNNVKKVVHKNCAN